MAYSVVLKLNENSGNGVSFLVKKMRCRFTRAYNAMTPNASPRCQEIELTMESPYKDYPQLTDWYVSNSKQSGSLLVRDGIKEVRTIAVFKNASCFYYGETYSSQQNRQITLRFDAETVISNEVEFTHL